MLCYILLCMSFRSLRVRCLWHPQADRQARLQSYTRVRSPECNYLLQVCIFTKEPLVFHGNYVLNIMTSELANSSDVHTSPSERDFERKAGEPLKGLEVQVRSNLKQNAEAVALGSSSSYVNCFITRLCFFV